MVVIATRMQSPDYYKDAAHFHIVGDGPEYRLEIPNAKLDYTGTYTVYAKNCHGDAKAIISLQIKVPEPPSFKMEKNKTKISELQTVPQITKDLKDIRCCDGDSATFECAFETNHPVLDIRWEKDGKILKLEGDFATEFDGENAKLNIKEVFPEDEGEYACIAYNNLGKAVTSACLVVDLPEEKENLLNAQLIRPPSSFAGGATPISTPRTTPNRLTPNRSVSPRVRERIVEEAPRRRYMRAQAPKFYAYPHNRVAEQGETVRFQCAIAGHPDPWVKWFKDGEEIAPSSRLIISEREDLRTLEIREVCPSDSGLYKIVLENDVGRVEANARLDVISHRLHSSQGLRARSLSPKTASTSYTRSLFSASARYGSTARLFCDIKARPSPYLRWYKDGIPLEDCAKYDFSYNEEVAALEISNVNLDDVGIYTCEAKNKNGKASTSVQLEVYEEDQEDVKPQDDKILNKNNKKIEFSAPRITKPLQKETYCTKGENVELTLNVEGYKPMDIVWMKDGCFLPDCENFRQEFNEENGIVTLTLNDVKTEDFGLFTCEVYNLYGEDSCRTNLLIKDSGLKKVEFTKHPTSLIVVEGGIASFCAKVKNFNGEKIKLIWDMDGETLFPSETIKVEEETTTADDNDVMTVSILHIFDASATGQIRCTAYRDCQNLSNISRQRGDFFNIKCALAAASTSNQSCTASENRDIVVCEAQSSPARLTIVTRDFVDTVVSSMDIQDHRDNNSSVDIHTVRVVPDEIQVVSIDSQTEKNHNNILADIGQLVQEQVDLNPANPCLQTITRFNCNGEDQLALNYKPIGNTKPLNFKVTAPVKDKAELNKEKTYIIQVQNNLLGKSPKDKDSVKKNETIHTLQKLELDAQTNKNIKTNLLEFPKKKTQLIISESTKSFNDKSVKVLQTNEITKNIKDQYKRISNKENVDFNFKTGGIKQTKSRANSDPLKTLDIFPKKFVSEDVKKDCSKSKHLSQIRVVNSNSSNLTITQPNKTSSTPNKSPKINKRKMLLRKAPPIECLDDEVFEDYSNLRVKMVDVEEPAMLIRGPQDTTALAGDRVLLKATYVGRPAPKVRWTRAGKELKNDERTSITSGDGVSCLLLQDITTDDSGKYDVSVENDHGSDCSYASVSVEGPPDPPSGTPCITTHYDTVTVTWSSSPYDGGKKVTGYVVEYTLCGSDIWSTAIDDCDSLSFVVGGLQLGAKYKFRVRAVNVHGMSKPSSESGTVQLEEFNESSTFEHRLVVPEPGPEFKARYEVYEELGKGRFGVVHKVVDRTTNLKLAAKFIKCRNQKDRDKVQDEIDIMNLLRHPKLLQMAAAFDSPREMIMVMEYISGGELFERVVADDFTLTEKDCILFMRQICEGVAYMHSQNVVHLDLKPENIMCHTRTSHEIKIIDFGLAQKIDPDKPVRVLFGTPEFIPPEIVSYEPIGIKSDMWSLGVICYVLLSGLSPFMGDNDSETLSNITRAVYDFEDEAFDTVSQIARDFISALLVKRKEDRLSAEQCLRHIWLDPDNHQETVVLSTDKLKKFIIRRKWQKTGNAIRALGRMATLSASRRNSANSNPNTPRPSISGSSVPRMSSFDMDRRNSKVRYEIDNMRVISTSFEEEEEDVTKHENKDLENTAMINKINIEDEEGLAKTLSQIKDLKFKENGFNIKSNLEHESQLKKDQGEFLNEDLKDFDKKHINEITTKSSHNQIELSNLENKESDETGDLFNENIVYDTEMIESQPKRNLYSAVNTEDLEDFTNIYTKTRKNSRDEIKNSKAIRARACSERSDSGISDCSTQFTSNSCSSTPLLGKKFPINEETESPTIEDKRDHTFITSTTLNIKPRVVSSRTITSSTISESDDQSETSSIGKEENGRSWKLSSKIESYNNGAVGKCKTVNQSNESIRRLPIYTSRTVAGTIKKFDHQLPTPEKSSNPENLVVNNNNINTLLPKLPNNVNSAKPPLSPNVSRRNVNSTIKSDRSRSPMKSNSKLSKVNNAVQKLEQSESDEAVFITASPTVRYRSPSPSLLRKTQACIAKEQSNEYYRSKHPLETAEIEAKNNVKHSIPKSPCLSRKPKSEAFQKAAAFWNTPKT